MRFCDRISFLFELELVPLLLSNRGACHNLFALLQLLPMTFHLFVSLLGRKLTIRVQT